MWANKIFEWFFLFIDTGAILAVSDCDGVHKAEKQASSRGVLFMGITGDWLHIDIQRQNNSNENIRINQNFAIRIVHISF